MRHGATLIIEQLKLANMATHGLYEHYCEEAGIDGPTPELETKIAATREAGHAIEKAIASLLEISNGA